jgi:two-component system invasion response regulator UvrY
VVGVLIVDDSELFRRTARDVIAATPGFVAVGEATSGEDALETLKGLDPGLVLLDVTMGGIDGIETARRITSVYPRPTVILISVKEPAELPSTVAQSGAAALVNKRHLSPALLSDLWGKHGNAETPSRDTRLTASSRD